MSEATALAVETCLVCREPHAHRGAHDARRYGPCKAHAEAADAVLASEWLADLLAHEREKAWHEAANATRAICRAEEERAAERNANARNSWARSRTDEAAKTAAWIEERIGREVSGQTYRIPPGAVDGEAGS